MRYLRKTLQSGEKPVCRSHLHGIYLVSGIVWFAVLAGIGWAADYNLWKYFGMYIPPYEISFQEFRLALAPGFFGWLMTAGGVLIFFTEFVKLASTDILVTNKRVLYKTGLIKVKIDSTDIADILGVHVDQGWFGQFLGYGKLHLDCRFVTDVYIPYAKNPYGIMKAVQRVREAGEHDTAAPAPEKQPVSQTLIQITGNNPVYIVDKVPTDAKTPLTQLPKALGDNMMSTFKRKA